jgi:hypothetical protein
MNRPLTASHPTHHARGRNAYNRRARLKRARAFFIIAVMVTLVSLAGHCLPGDDPSATAGTMTQSLPGR